jgi:hypothetical protein
LHDDQNLSQFGQFEQLHGLSVILFHQPPIKTNEAWFKIGYSHKCICIKWF